MIIRHWINDFKNIIPGHIYTTSQNGNLEILERDHNNIIVRFLDTGYVRSSTINKLKAGVIKDKYRPIVYGVGYYGENKIPNSRSKRMLYTRWKNMISRCYNSDNKYYRLYGGVGVRVSERWHNFSNFIEDVTKIDGWDMDKFLSNKITLDKDKLQKDKDPSEKVYSKDTCCWLTVKEQNQLIDFEKSHAHEMIPFVWEYNGNSGIYLGIGKFAKEHNLIKNQISKCIDGVYSQHKGYHFRKCTNQELKSIDTFNDYPRDGR